MAYAGTPSFLSERAARPASAESPQRISDQVRNPTLPSCGLRAPSSSTRDAAGAPGILAAVLAVCAAGLLLCVVAVANGHPLIWGDTRAYFMAGNAAVERGLALLAALLSEPGGGAPADPGTAAADGFRDVAAIRSAYYGALIYIPAAALRSTKLRETLLADARALGALLAA